MDTRFDAFLLELDHALRRDALPASGSQYEAELRRWLSFLTDRGYAPHVHPVTINAYLMHLAGLGHAATSLRVSFCKLSKMLLLVFGVDVAEDSAYKVTRMWLCTRERAHVPKQAVPYDGDLLLAWIRAGVDDVDADVDVLSLRVFAILALAGLLRVSAAYGLTVGAVQRREDDTYVVQTGAQKHAAAGHRFVVTVPAHVALLDRYMALRSSDARAAVLAPPLFLRWNPRGRQFCLQRRGMGWFSQASKEIARLSGHAGWAAFTTHAMRRTGATILYNRGASVLEIMRAGGWKSDRLVNHYVATSDAEKRRVARRFEEE